MPSYPSETHNSVSLILDQNEYTGDRGHFSVKIRRRIVIQDYGNSPSEHRAVLEINAEMADLGDFEETSIQTGDSPVALTVYCKNNKFCVRDTITQDGDVLNEVDTQGVLTVCDKQGAENVKAALETLTARTRR